MTQPNWFLALAVPPSAGWHHAGDDLPPGLRRFAAADLHLTVAFLGPCPEPVARAAWAACEPLQQPAITASAGPWRAMGPPSRPSAYALTIRAGREPLCHLIEACRERLRQAELLPAAPAGRRQKPPLPHITLARPRRRDAGEVRRAMAAWMRGAPLPRGPLVLERLALYTWNDDRREQLFRIAAQRLLAGGTLGS